MAVVYVGKLLKDSQTEVKVCRQGEVRLLQNPKTRKTQTRHTFWWGDRGAHSFLLALALLYDAFPRHRAVCRRWAAWFCDDVVAYFPEKGWTMRRKDIHDWFMDQNIGVADYLPMCFESEN